jgi:hypothetical protein
MDMQFNRRYATGMHIITVPWVETHGYHHKSLLD